MHTSPALAPFFAPATGRDALGLGSRVQAIADRASVGYHEARHEAAMAACDILDPAHHDFRAAYDMGGDLPAGGLTDAQINAADEADFWSRLGL